MYLTVSIVFPFKLGPKSHLAGPSFTLADVTVFPTVATLFRFGWARGETMLGADVTCGLSLHVEHLFWFCRLSADRFPKLGEYYALLKDRPSIKASWPPHWLENLKGQDDLKDIWQLVEAPQSHVFVLHRLFCLLQLQMLLNMTVNFSNTGSKWPVLCDQLVQTWDVELLQHIRRH